MIVLDSISEAGARITTFQLRYPRMIHSELMTHRVLSRNARSSRAVPAEKMIAEVRERAAVPEEWGSNQKGMVAGQPLRAAALTAAKWAWHDAAMAACGYAEKLHEAGCHKQIVNRVIEPFTFIDVIVTATDFSNFFALRCAPDADPTIRALALSMRSAYEASTPVLREKHVPFGPNMDEFVASCARVSYGKFNGRDNEAFVDKLMTSQHWSPFEHQAFAMTSPTGRSRNFTGWIQYREVVGG